MGIGRKKSADRWSRAAWQVAVSGTLWIGVQSTISAQSRYENIGCPDPAAYVLTAKNVGESGQLHSGFSLSGTIKNVGLRAYKSKYASEAAPTPALRVRLKKGNSVLKEEVLYGLKAGEEFKIYISTNDKMSPSTFESTWFALTVEEILGPGGGPQSSLNPAYKAECNPGNNEKKIQGSGPRAWSSAGAGREIPWRNPEVI